MHRYLRVTSRLDEVKAGVYPIVDDLLAVDAIFLLEVRVEARLDVFDDRPPTAEDVELILVEMPGPIVPNLSSLLTKSPNPGVSTTFK